MTETQANLDWKLRIPNAIKIKFTNFTKWKEAGIYLSTC